MTKKHRIFLNLCFIISLIASINCNVIGFDFGSSFFKITLVKPGQPFAIVENTSSQRKTHNMVTITDETRLFGPDSFMEVTKYPQSTFPSTVKWLGKVYDKSTIELLKDEEFIYNQLQDDGRGLVGWILKKKGSDDQTLLYTEELVAQILKFGRQLSEKQAGGTIKDCVITIPSYFTLQQKRMLLEAADLAGLYVLQLVHENIAAAVMYGIDRLDKDKDHTVLFYNMGGQDTEVTLVKYTAIQDISANNKTTEYIEILGETYDNDLGGSVLDKAFVNLLAEKFNALPERKDKEDVRQNARAMKRLHKEVVKAKDILSANKFVNMKIGELLDYTSLITVIDRKEFEDVNQEGFFSRIAKPIEEVLKKTGVDIKDIDQIELLGGGIRVPKLQEDLAGYLGIQQSDLGVHLNGDEAMCFGAAFIASNSSASFKVRKVFLTQHPFGEYEIKIRPQNSEGIVDTEDIKYEKEYALYKTSDFLGQKKSVSLTYDQDMIIEVFYVKDSQKELIQTYKLDGISEIAQNDIAKKEGSSKPKVTLHFELSRSGIFALNKAEAKMDELYFVEEKPKKKVEKPTEEKEKTEDEAKLNEDATKNDSEAQEGKEIKDEEPEQELKKIQKRRVHPYSLTKLNKEEHNLNLLSRDQIYAAKERLNAWEKRDADKVRTDKAKNDFESLIYAYREWLNEDENQAFIPPGQAEETLTKLSNEEEWLLDGEGEHAHYAEYLRKYNEIKKGYDLLKGRKSEYNTRQSTIDQGREKLKQLELNIDGLAIKKKWITDEQKKDVLEKLSETKVWLEDLIEKQKEVALHEEPVLKGIDVENKIKRVDTMFTRVSNIQKPKDLNKDKYKNIKIDNITIDGNEGGNWEDFIKIDNGRGGNRDWDNDDDSVNNQYNNKDNRQNNDEENLKSEEL